MLLAAGADKSDFKVSLLIYAGDLIERLPKCLQQAIDDEPNEQARMEMVRKNFPTETTAIEELRQLI